MANYVLFSNASWMKQLRLSYEQKSRFPSVLNLALRISMQSEMLLSWFMSRIRSRKRLNPDTFTHSLIKTPPQRAVWNAAVLIHLNYYQIFIFFKHAIKNALERRRVKLIKKIYTKIHFKMPILNLVEIVLIKRDCDWRDAVISFGFISFYLMNISWASVMCAAFPQQCEVHCFSFIRCRSCIRGSKSRTHLIHAPLQRRNNTEPTSHHEAEKPNPKEVETRGGE